MIIILIFIIINITGVDENESPDLMAEFTNNAVTPLPPAILTAEDIAVSLVPFFK